MEAVNQAYGNDARCYVLLRLGDLLGLRFSPGMYSQLCSRNAQIFRFTNPLDETDLRHFKERTKQMGLISHSKGFMLRMKGILSKDPLERERLLSMSAKCFSQALSMNPFSKVSLRNYGDVLYFLGRSPLAEHAFQRCVKIDPSDTNSLFKYGMGDSNPLMRIRGD